MTMRTDRGNGFGKALALALGGVIAGGGCVTVPRSPTDPPPPTYKDPTVLKVKFAGRCPIDVMVPADAKQCPPGKYKCVRVKSGHTVKFEADPLLYDPQIPDAFNTFVLHFDPFDKNTIESDKGFVALPTRKSKDAAVTLDKAHTFIVTSKDAPPGCDPVDPQIILD